MIFNFKFVSSDEFNNVKDSLQNVICEELNRDEYLGSYSSFIGSPLYNGKLQFDLWDSNITDIHHDWTSLRRTLKDMV